jgi:RNA polymerase sigma-70 factor (ECF subfamily)
MEDRPETTENRTFSEKADECVPSEPDRGTRLAQLFESHNDALLRFLTCKLKSAQEAKEVAQEAYVRLLQLDSTDGISYLRALLFKTALNLAKDRLKSTARRRRIESLEFFNLSPPASPSPEFALCALQEIEAVLKILDDLPPKCRYAFIMNRFHGRSLAEIGGLMNLSERMVRLYIERALVYCCERLRQTGTHHG